jgi:hypothetical protein
VVAYGSQKVFDFPASLIAILGASTDLDVTKSGSGINADFDGDFALGTAAASNNASLTGTEQNVIASTATPQASSGVTTADGESVSSLTSLTDSTGGVANDTLEDLGTLALSTSNTYTDAAVNTAVNAILAKVENCLADLAAKVNAVIANVNGLKAVVVDGTTTAADLFLNFLIDDGDQDGGGTLSVTGTITLVWISLGDN